MLTSRRITGVLLAAAVMMLTMPRFASSQDADTQEVLRYTLTDSGLAKYVQATRQLAALPGGVPGNCDDEDTESASLDEVVARVDAVPGAKAAIQSAGLSTREYMLFSLSLLQNGMAAWATSQPGGTLPPGVSKSNVDFVKKHDAELKQLEGLSKQGDCGDETADDEGKE
jgi:hypothetical protein